MSAKTLLDQQKAIINLPVLKGYGEILKGFLIAPVFRPEIVSEKNILALAERAITRFLLKVRAI